ncbi:MAG: hypothetical protein ACOC7J_06270 [Armatimonadota bacterium]
MMMSFEDLLQANRLRPHEPTLSEIRDLIDGALRDLRHVAATTDSDDWRFIAAYSAALSLATVPLVASGYRASGPGHHATVIKALPASIGAQVQELSVYLDECRALRNKALYDQPHIATPSKVKELLEAVDELQKCVLTWLAEQHPELLPEAEFEE